MSVRRRVPFAQIPEWLIRADVSAHAVRLWAALDRFAGLPHGAMPSRATLAAEWLRVSIVTLDRAKTELIEIGALTVEERSGDTNVYWLEDVPVRGPLLTGEEITLLTDEEIPSSRVRNERELAKESKGERTPSAEVSAQVRGQIWDALSAATGIEPISHSEKTRFGMSTSDLVKLEATPDEIRVRAAHFAERYPGATLTDRALVNRWGELANGAPRSRKRRYGTGVTAGELGDLAQQLRQEGR